MPATARASAAQPEAPAPPGSPAGAAAALHAIQIFSRDAASGCSARASSATAAGVRGPKPSSFSPSITRMRPLTAAGVCESAGRRQRRLGAAGGRDDMVGQQHRIRREADRRLGRERLVALEAARRRCGRGQARSSHRPRCRCPAAIGAPLATEIRNSTDGRSATRASADFDRRHLRARPAPPARRPRPSSPSAAPTKAIFGRRRTPKPSPSGATARRRARRRAAGPSPPAARHRRSASTRSGISERMPSAESRRR